MLTTHSVSRRAWLGTVVATTLAGIGQAQDKETQKPTQEELEQAFAERMSGAVLVGHYSIIGQETKPSSPERYELKKVSKVGGDLWTFEARIKYGQTDVTLPITLRMIWAEDTPMITLTNATLPGLGSAFGTRLIFDGDRYAGTWQHGKVGGHMWGVIEKADGAKGESPK